MAMGQTFKSCAVHPHNALTVQYAVWVCDESRTC